MAVEHKNIADPYRHEPKGIDALGVSDAGKVYVADGAGSGAWDYPDTVITGWRDLMAPFSAGAAATKPPEFKAWSGMGGLYGYHFTAGEQLFLTFHIDHDYKEGTALYPHVHWCPTVAMSNAETVTWEIEWTFARGHNQNAFGAPTTVADSLLTYTSVGTTPAQQHIVTETASGITFTDLEPDSIIVARVERTATGTYTSEVVGFAMDCHYETDKIATLGKAPDFSTP